MVAVLLGLKWANFTAVFRAGNVWAIIGIIFGGLYTMGAAASLGFAGFFIERDSLFTAFVLFGAVLSLAWWLVPLVASAADATLDPERLAPYPLTARQLMGGQALGALIGTPGFATLLLALASATTLFAAGWGGLLYPVTIVLGLALTIVVSRLITLASIPLRARRGISNTMTAISFTALMLAGPLIISATGGILAIIDTLPAILTVLQWTPLGAPWAIYPQAVAGNYALAGALTLISLIYLATAWWLWEKATQRTMANVGALTPPTAGKTLASGNLGLLGRFPATPRWAVAARCIHMLLKDSRCNVNILTIPLFYLLFIFMGSFSVQMGEEGGEVYSNNGMAAFFLLVFLPSFAGYIAASLTSYENSAFSLHVLSPLRGIDDRLGRVYATALLFGPMILAGTLYFSIWHLQAGAATLPLLLYALSLFGIGLGLAAYIDTLISIPTPPPGASPWKTPKQPDGFAKALVRGLLMFIPMLAGLPGGIALIYATSNDHHLWAWAGAGTTLLLAALALMLGTRAGADRYNTHSADILARVSRF